MECAVADLHKKHEILLLNRSKYLPRLKELVPIDQSAPWGNEPGVLSLPTTSLLQEWALADSTSSRKGSCQ